MTFFLTLTLHHDKKMESWIGEKCKRWYGPCQVSCTVSNLGLKSCQDIMSLFFTTTRLFKMHTYCMDYYLDVPLSDLHKTLILAHLRKGENDDYTVEEMALATEHAPFRHRKNTIEVGSQRKKAKLETSVDTSAATTNKTASTTTTTTNSINNIEATAATSIDTTTMSVQLNGLPPSNSEGKCSDGDDGDDDMVLDRATGGVGNTVPLVTKLSNDNIDKDVSANEAATNMESANR